jgi:hypothetical protein
MSDNPTGAPDESSRGKRSEDGGASEPQEKPRRIAGRSKEIADAASNALAGIIEKSPDLAEKAAAVAPQAARKVAERAPQIAQAATRRTSSSTIRKAVMKAADETAKRAPQIADAVATQAPKLARKAADQASRMKRSEQGKDGEPTRDAGEGDEASPSR